MTNFILTSEVLGLVHKYVFFCHNQPSIENPSKLFARNFGKSIFGPTLIDRSAFIRGRTELWLGLFDFSDYSAYGTTIKKSITNF
jgi:hypothetical protein